MWELTFPFALLALAIAAPFVLYVLKDTVGFFGIPLGIVSIGFLIFTVDLLVKTRLICCTSQPDDTFITWFIVTYALMGLLSGLFLGAPLPFSLWWLSWLWVAGSSVVAGSIMSMTTTGDMSSTIVAYLFAFVTGLILVVGGAFLWSISKKQGPLVVRK